MREQTEEIQINKNVMEMRNSWETLKVWIELRQGEVNKFNNLLDFHFYPSQKY